MFFLNLEFLFIFAFTANECPPVRHTYMRLAMTSSYKPFITFSARRM